MSFSALFRRSVVALTTTVTISVVGSPMQVAYAGGSSTEIVANDEQQAQRVGNELRTERRWAEAIEHYDKSLKTWPDNESFQSGLRQSRRHFSIDRRYADKSFQDRLLPLSQLDSMTYFDDMLKIHRFGVTTELSSKPDDDGRQCKVPQTRIYKNKSASLALLYVFFPRFSRST